MWDKRDEDIANSFLPEVNFSLLGCVFPSQPSLLRYIRLEATRRAPDRIQRIDPTQPLFSTLAIKTMFSINKSTDLKCHFDLRNFQGFWTKLTHRYERLKFDFVFGKAFSNSLSDFFSLKLTAFISNFAAMSFFYRVMADKAKDNVFEVRYSQITRDFLGFCDLLFEAKLKHNLDKNEQTPSFRLQFHKVLHERYRYVFYTLLDPYVIRRSQLRLYCESNVGHFFERPDEEGSSNFFQRKSMVKPKFPEDYRNESGSFFRVGFKYGEGQRPEVFGQLRGRMGPGLEGNLLVSSNYRVFLASRVAVSEGVSLVNSIRMGLRSSRAAADAFSFGVGLEIRA